MSTAIRRAIYGKLAGDTTLTAMLGTPPPPKAQSIWHNSAGANATYPLVTLNKQSGVPTEAFTDPSALEEDVWLVKAIDRDTSADDAEAVAARVQTLLNDAALSIAGGATHLYLRRQSDVEFEEVTDGVKFQHVGALYRLVYDP